MQLALEEIDDKNISIVPRDSGFNDKEKLNIAIQDIRSQGVKIIIGPITYEEFEDALKSLEESKRILIYRAARGIDEEYMNRGLLSFIRSSVVNTQIDDREVDSRVMSDEEKVIEKLVIGDKFFQPIQSQQLFTRPSRPMETSFEGIFWAFALLAFAVAIMFLINNTK